MVMYCKATSTFERYTQNIWKPFYEFPVIRGIAAPPCCDKANGDGGFS